MNPNAPAFARPASEFTANGTLLEGNDAIPHADGLTKREWFAGMALQCIRLQSEDDLPMPLDRCALSVARCAVAVADALLAELSKEP